MSGSLFNIPHFCNHRPEAPEICNVKYFHHPDITDKVMHNNKYMSENPGRMLNYLSILPEHPDINMQKCIRLSENTDDVQNNYIVSIDICNKLS